MAKTSINYLFPPEKISELETWRFVLHFKAPLFFRGSRFNKARRLLEDTTWKAITFPVALDTLQFDERESTIGIPVEVSEDRRAKPNSLSDYESDVWKIYGNMIQAGFGDLYYEAVDWKQ